MKSYDSVILYKMTSIADCIISVDALAGDKEGEPGVLDYFCCKDKYCHTTIDYYHMNKIFRDNSDLLSKILVDCLNTVYKDKKLSEIKGTKLLSRDYEQDEEQKELPIEIENEEGLYDKTVKCITKLNCCCSLGEKMIKLYKSCIGCITKLKGCCKSNPEPVPDQNIPIPHILMKELDDYIQLFLKHKRYIEFKKTYKYQVPNEKFDKYIKRFLLQKHPVIECNVYENTLEKIKCMISSIDTVISIVNNHLSAKNEKEIPIKDITKSVDLSNENSKLFESYISYYEYLYGNKIILGKNSSVIHREKAKQYEYIDMLFKDKKLSELGLDTITVLESTINSNYFDNVMQTKILFHRRRNKGICILFSLFFLLTLLILAFNRLTDLSN